MKLTRLCVLFRTSVVLVELLQQLMTICCYNARIF